MVEKHLHTGIDSPKLILGECVDNAPQEALTTANGGTLSTGGAAVLSTNDATIINNAITRLGELETRLQTLGLLS